MAEKRNKKTGENSVYLGINPDPGSLTFTDEIKFVGKPADEFYRAAIIRHQRRRCLFSSLQLLPLIAFCAVILIFTFLSSASNTADSMLREKLGFNPDFTPFYYDVYVRSEWYNTVSNADIDIYRDYREGTRNWNLVAEAFEEEFGFENTYNSPWDVFTPPDSLEVFEQKMRQKAEEAKVEISGEVMMYKGIMYALSGAVGFAFLCFVYFMAIMPPSVRRMKNGELMVCEGKCLEFARVKNFYMHIILDEESEHSPVYLNVLIKPDMLTIADRRAFRREEIVNIIAVRIEPDTSKSPKTYIFPASLVEEKAEKLRKHGIMI